MNSNISDHAELALVEASFLASSQRISLATVQAQQLNALREQLAIARDADIRRRTEEQWRHILFEVSNWNRAVRGHLEADPKLAWAEIVEVVAAIEGWQLDHQKFTALEWKNFCRETVGESKKLLDLAFSALPKREQWNIKKLIADHAAEMQKKGVEAEERKKAGIKLRLEREDMVGCAGFVFWLPVVGAIFGLAKGSEGAVVVFGVISVVGLITYITAKIRFPAATKNPFAAPHFNRANELFKSGDIETALLEYERVLEIEPSHYKALHNVQVCKERLGR